MGSKTYLNIISRLICAAVLFLQSPATHADEIILQNGDRLSGEVVRHRDEYIYFKTPYSNTIRIEWQAVKEVRTTKKLPVLMKDDSLVEAAGVTEEGDPKRNILRKSEVRAVKPKTNIFGDWVKSQGLVTVGFDFERGNNRDKDEINIEGLGFFRTSHNRLSANLKYELEERAEIKSKDNWDGFLQVDDFITEKVFWGLLGSYKIDEFTSLQSRRIYAPLLGYQFIERPRFDFWLQAGPTRVLEDYDQKGSSDFWGTGAGVVLNYRLVDESLFLFNRWFGLMSNEDSSKYILRLTTGFTLPLISGISITAEFGYDYDSQPDIDADKSEPDYSIKLGYVW